MKTARRLAAVNVVVSVAAAAALLIAVNVVGDLAAVRRSYRWNVETLARYGLSPTAKRVLDEIGQKIILTSIYTSADPKKKPEDYLPRVRDLLNEMGEYGRDVTVINVTTDRQKAEVLSRLRRRLDAKAQDQGEAIKAFQSLANRQIPQYDQIIGRWKAYPAKGWLGGFGLAKAVENALTANKEDLRSAAADVRAQLAGSALPNYPRMTETVTEALENVRGRLEGIRRSLREIGTIPEKANQAKPQLSKALAAATAAAEKVAAAAGKVGAPEPADPPAVLNKIAAASTELANAAADAQAALEKFSADCGEGQYLPYARAWVVDMVPLPARCQGLAGAARRLTEQALGVRETVKVEVQKTFIVEQIRPVMPALEAEAKKIEAGLARLLAELGEPDQGTKDILETARKDEYLQAQSEPVGQLLERLAGLDKLESQDELPDQIKQENIVLVEVGEKAGVVSMDDVWPLASRRDWEMGLFGEEEERRVFNGDMAISSKLLSLALPPLGEVVLTFFEDIPPYMVQGRPAIAGQIPSIWLGALRERLEKADLKVTEWNLAREDEPPKAEKGRKQVLLVLPPPEPMPMPPMGGQELPQWNDQQVEKIRKAIDAGANAVFLARYLRPTRWGMTESPQYGLAEYLKTDWGLEVKTDLRVVQALADELNPGTCKLPVVRWWYMPLSTFTKHPVGEPLRARRLYWADACPILKAKDSHPGVTVEDILVVPKGSATCWAASNAQQLERQMWLGEGSGIVPASAQGDLAPPLALAVEARKTIGERTARIIVLGVGYSFIDQFLTPRVPRFEADETMESDPPPTGNVDLIINSAYHLVGQGDFIGAGPAIVQPIRIIDPGMMAVVKIGFGLIWPLLVLVVGVIIMVVRTQ
ncbi:MAG: hypothetical protein AMJ81_06560 [Phycisphaerae bacterium SM23_33]|nr:MAG: hypothetical protein AMJ81_06560 [Phycisphaerae bacterium SM23_33]